MPPLPTHTRTHTHTHTHTHTYIIFVIICFLTHHFCYNWWSTHRCVKKKFFYNKNSFFTHLRVDHHAEGYTRNTLIRGGVHTTPPLILTHLRVDHHAEGHTRNTLIRGGVYTTPPLILTHLRIDHHVSPRTVSTPPFINVFLMCVHTCALTTTSHLEPLLVQHGV